MAKKKPTEYILTTDGVSGGYCKFVARHWDENGKYCYDKQSNYKTVILEWINEHGVLKEDRTLNRSKSDQIMAPHKIENKKRHYYIKPFKVSGKIYYGLYEQNNTKAGPIMKTTKLSNLEEPVLDYNRLTKAAEKEDSENKKALKFLTSKFGKLAEAERVDGYRDFLIVSDEHGFVGELLSTLLYTVMYNNNPTPNSIIYFKDDNPCNYSEDNLVCID